MASDGGLTPGRREGATMDDAAILAAARHYGEARARLVAARRHLRELGKRDWDARALDACAESHPLYRAVVERNEAEAETYARLRLLDAALGIAAE